MTTALWHPAVERRTQLVKKERPPVSRHRNLLCFPRSDSAVAGVREADQKYRQLRCTRRLQSGREFPRVPWIHAQIVLPNHQQNSRILCVIEDMLVRRISI